jgi:hypothetical protein
MENAGNTSTQEEIPKESEDGGEDPAERVRNFIGLATGVAGTVAAFLVGFGILPDALLSEQLLNFFAAIGLSGAIIAGIGAWRSIRRFIFMWAFIAIVLACLASLAVVAARAAASQSATGASRAPHTPASSASSLPVKSPNGFSATSSVGLSAGSQTSVNSPAASSGYAVEFGGQQFTIPGAGCTDDSYYPYVLFMPRGPYSDADDYNTSLSGPDGTYDGGEYDMYLQCYPDVEIGFLGQAAIFSGKPNAEACEKQVTSNPLPAGAEAGGANAGGTVDFSQLTPGMQFCLVGGGGNNLVYIKLLAVSDTSYTTTWVATAWTIPAHN